MHEHHHIDPFRHRGRRADDLAHVHGSQQQIVDRPGVVLAPARLGHRRTGDRQAGNQPDGGPLRIGEAVDDAGDVVFKVAFAGFVEERDQLDIVRRIGAGKAEEDALAGAVHGKALEAEGVGPVLGVGERFGIEDPEFDLAVGERGEFLQQVAHMARIDAHLRNLPRDAAGEVEAEHDRLVDLLHHPLRILREREGALLRQVEARVAQQPVGQRDPRHEQHRQQHQGQPGEQAALPVPLHRRHRLSLPSSDRRLWWPQPARRRLRARNRRCRAGRSRP